MCNSKSCGVKNEIGEIKRRVDMVKFREREHTINWNCCCCQMGLCSSDKGDWYNTTFWGYIPFNSQTFTSSITFTSQNILSTKIIRFCKLETRFRSQNNFKTLCAFQKSIIFDSMILIRKKNNVLGNPTSGIGDIGLSRTILGPEPVRVLSP